MRKNGGGVYAHNLYFSAMSPEAASTMPYGRLDDAIARQFGSTEELLKQLEAAAAARFGSGWAWLVTSPTGKIVVINGIGAFLAYVVPLFQGLATLTP